MLMTTNSDNNQHKKDTSWGNVADWYSELLEEGKDTYQSAVVLPNILRLLALQKGEAVLDLACGQGFFSRAYAQTGAVVTGIDLGKSLIEIAQEKTREADITYHVASADAIPMIPDQSVDKATIVLALQNIENMKGALTECARVIKPGGMLVIVLNHPTFRIPKKSAWGFDEDQDVQYRRVDAYLSELRQEIEMNPGKNGVEDQSETTVSFHRPLQSYFKALEKAGLVVHRLEEWTSHKESQDGPRKAAEDRARREIPLFMAIQARKNGKM